jgi:hypothetical protein
MEKKRKDWQVVRKKLSGGRLPFQERDAARAEPAWRRRLETQTA